MADQASPHRAASLADDHTELMFREAMSRFATGVTIVTSVDQTGRPRGFTASAFCSLSADPALILVCLDRGARCYETFMRAPVFSVSILADRHQDIALRFSSRTQDDKFRAGEFTVDSFGGVRMNGALAALTCETYRRVPMGDHTIIVGRVLGAEVSHGQPSIYFQRQFWQLCDARCASWPSYSIINSREEP
jgi:flavin reductase ActVB